MAETAMVNDGRNGHGWTQTTKPTSKTDTKNSNLLQHYSRLSAEIQIMSIEVKEVLRRPPPNVLIVTHRGRKHAQLT